MKKIINILVIVCVCFICSMSFEKMKINAAANNENTDTEKVEIDSGVTIAEVGKYKNMDYTFLKKYDYGNSTECTNVYENVEKLKQASLQDGIIVKTKGYYKSGDMGAAIYEISSKKQAYSIQLENGFYANIVPDVYVDKQGIRWLIGNIRQFGAAGDGKVEDHQAIGNALVCIGSLVNAKDQNKYDRGIVYMPEGEYKLGDQINVNYGKLNIVGEGDSTVLFTDNDYRDEEGYSEFLFACWGGFDNYFADFKLEAREVDLYKYMRQFVVVYSQNIYVHRVNLIIPQSTYGSYFFEDKQYSNFCCYSGNKNVTVDNCRMEQMSGTYRGANIGVLDIWAAGEDNITIMNCDLYGNARDEQVGFFSKNDNNAHVKNVDFINNTMHSVQLKYPEIIGTRTMCFTIAYADSNEVDDIHIAGNHFVCESDSKFITFGAVKNCVIEKNIIEIKCTYSTWSMLFDSCNGDPNNILIQKNDIYITSDFNKGRGSVTNGNLTLKDNNILADEKIMYGIQGPEIHGNNMVFLEQIGPIGENSNVTGNNIEVYNTFNSVGVKRQQCALYNNSNKYSFSGNKIWDYFRYSKYEIFRSIIMLDGDVQGLDVSNNEIYFPNARFITSESSESTKFNDSLGTYYKNNLFRKRSGKYGKITVNNNVLQNIEDPSKDSTFSCSGNKFLEPEENLDEQLATDAKITYQGKEISTISFEGEKMPLSCIVSADGKVLSGKTVKWYTSSKTMATISENGELKRKLFGTVHVYAVLTDGSGVYAECVVNFEKNKSYNIEFEKNGVDLEVGLKYYTEYKVLPEGASQKVLWTSSNPDVASVDQNGVILGLKKGTTTITASTMDGTNVVKSFKVTVGITTVKKIKFDQEYYYFKNSEIGTTKKIVAASYFPENAENKGILKITSSHPEVVQVNEKNEIKILAGGKSKIEAYSLDGKKCGKLYVYVQPSKLSNFKIDYYTSDKVHLTWDAQDNTRSYYVYQWNYSKNVWNPLNKDKELKNTSYTISNLSPNTKYKFSVRPVVLRWEVGEQEIYEGEDNIAEIKTLTYIPVTTLKTYSPKISVYLNEETAHEFVYSPVDANYKDLCLKTKFTDNGIVTVTNCTMKNGKAALTYKGIKYGGTHVTVSVSDDLGKSVDVAVGVVAKNVLPTGAEYVSFKPSSQGTDIEFTGVDNEKELLQTGGMTGYMVQRTQTATFNDLLYVPANGEGKYKCFDSTAQAGKVYRYRVCLCSKYGDDFFIGRGNGSYEVIMPAASNASNAKSVELSDETYIVKTGDTLQVSATVESEGVAEHTLTWETEESEIAKVERKENSEELTNTEEKANTDYAIISGVKPGVTIINVQTTDNTDLSAHAKVIVLPDSVTNVKTASSTDYVGIIWDLKDNVDGYHVYKYNQSLSSWIMIGDTQNNSFIDTSATTSLKSRYKVVAYLKIDGKYYEGEDSDDAVSATVIIPEDGKPITINGYHGTYDGKSHSAVYILNTEENDVITYSLNSREWEANVPLVENVLDSKVIHVRLNRNNKDYYYSVIAKIDPIAISSVGFELDNNQIAWNGKNQYPNIKCTSKEKVDYTVSYSGSGEKIGDYVVKIKGNGNYFGIKKIMYSVILPKNSVYKTSGFNVKIIDDTSVSIQGLIDKSKKKVIIPDTVKIANKKLKVTAISNKAFMNNKNIIYVKIGKNVSKIGSKAFMKDAKLKKIVISGKKIKFIGKNAIKSINKKASIVVPKTMKQKYVKLFTTKTGFKNSMVIK